MLKNIAILFTYLARITICCRCFLLLIFKFSLIVGFCFSVSGCFSAATHKYVEKKQYLLNLPLLPTKKSAIPKQDIVVHPITAFAAFDQNYFLYRVSKNQYLIDYYNGFMISVTRQLDPVLISYLKHSGFMNVGIAQDSAALQNELRVQITDLYADYRDRTQPRAVAALHFILTTKKDGKTVVLLDRTFHSIIPLKAKNTDSLLAAWSKGLQIDLTAAVWEMQHRFH